MRRITLYTKPGCHLCEAVEQTIRRVSQRASFELEIRDIDCDAGDREKFGLLIPVVLLDGKEIARYRVSEAELSAALRKAD